MAPATTIRRWAGIGLALALMGGSAAAESWDMATPFPESNFHTQNILQFAKDVDAATKGALTIKVHAANSLISHAEIKNSVRAGTIPIGEFLLGRLANEHPLYELDMLPFLIDSYDDARTIWAASKPQIARLLERQNMNILFSVPWPNNGIYANREIRNAADMRGLKLRTYNLTTDRLAVLLGAVPTQIEVSDIAQAYSTGRVESLITSASTGVSIAAWDFAKRYYDVTSFLGKNIVVVNARRFQALPADVQKAVLAAAAAAETRGWELSKSNDAEMAAVLTKNGIIVEKPSAEFQRGMKEIGNKMLAEWLARAGEEGKAVVGQLRR